MGADKRLRVLVVDDETHIRQIMKINLRRCDCEVTEARNGEEAIDLALMSRFDLIFLDIMMPYMDGYSVMRRIREHEQSPNRGTPVVAVSALRSEVDKQRAAELGFLCFVTKPFQGTQLRDLVEQVRAQSEV